MRGAVWSPPASAEGRESPYCWSADPRMDLSGGMDDASASHGRTADGSADGPQVCAEGIDASRAGSAPKRTGREAGDHPAKAEGTAEEGGRHGLLGNQHAQGVWGC